VNISFAVTAYEETSHRRQGECRITKCLRSALEHESVTEVVVVNDASDDYYLLYDKISGLPKVKIYQNEENLGVFGNKLESVARCTGNWVICCDSDNVMDDEYITKVVEQIELGQKLAKIDYWHCPSFAKPKFDYRPFIGEYHLGNIVELVQSGGLSGCLMNTGNQTVNREAFLAVFEKYRGCRADLMMPNWLGITQEERRKRHYRIVFDACDSLIFNMEWLKAGGVLNVVEGLEYEHYWTGSEESHYNRAPKEKHQLNEILLKELVAAGRQHEVKI